MSAKHADVAAELMVLYSFGQARALRSDAVRVVAYSPYREGEGAYATFQFFYRSEGSRALHRRFILWTQMTDYLPGVDMLRKFNFPGFHQSRSVYRNRRYLNAKLATLTPLGISQPLRRKNESDKEKATSFEETIKIGASPVKHPVEYRFSDGYRQDDEKIKKEESICGLDDVPLWLSLPSPSRPGSCSPPKISSNGSEKENQRPNKIDKWADVGQVDQHTTPLGNKLLTSPSQIPKMASFINPQPSQVVLPPTHQAADSTFEGPDISLLGERVASTISLPSTENATSPNSAEDSQPNHELYRKPLCESDADDEASDKETHHGSDEEIVGDLEYVRYEDAETDELLQSAMHKIQLGKRGRDGDDDDGEDDEGRPEIGGGGFGLRSATHTGLSMLEMRDLRDAERERDVAKEIEAHALMARDTESAGPAKRRKGSDGQLVGMIGSSLDARVDEGEMVGGEMGRTSEAQRWE